MTNCQRIMVVDDEPQIGQMLTQFLGKHNYEALFFTSGKKALAYLSANPDSHRDCGKTNPRAPISCPSPLRSFGTAEDGGTDCGLAGGLTSEAVGLLLTDMAMPEIHGIELARQVKTLYPKLPIIVMSGSADGQDRDEIFKLGADFIPKPFQLIDLLMLINFLIAKSKIL